MALGGSGRLGSSRAAGRSSGADMGELGTSPPVAALVLPWAAGPWALRLDVGFLELFAVRYASQARLVTRDERAAIG